MSYNAQDWVRTLSIEMSSDRHVMLELANHFNDTTKACHPSLKTLASEVRLSIPTVRACLDRLVKAGYLIAVPRSVEGVRIGTNYSFVGYNPSGGTQTTCTPCKPFVDGENDLHSYENDLQGVCKPLSRGIQTTYTGVCKSFAPNKEYKQVNKQGNRTSKDIAPKPKRQKQVFEKPDDLSQELFDRIVQYRKDIKKPFKTQNGLDRIIGQIRKANQATGASYDEIVDFWTAKEWQGFEADWFIKTVNEPKHVNSYGNQASGYHSVTYVPEIPEDVITDWTDLDEFKN